MSDDLAVEKMKLKETKYPISGSRVLELVLREGGAVTSAFQVRIWDVFPESHGVEVANFNLD